MGKQQLELIAHVYTVTIKEGVWALERRDVGYKEHEGGWLSTTDSNALFHHGRPSMHSTYAMDKAIKMDGTMSLTLLERDDHKAWELFNDFLCGREQFTAMEHNAAKAKRESFQSLEPR